MLRDYLTVMFFFWRKDLKNWFVQKWDWFADILFIHVWHRRHVFRFQDAVRAVRESPCMFCGLTIDEVTKREQKFKILLVPVVLLLALEGRLVS